MVGDFNVKIGHHILGNKETVSKRGKTARKNNWEIQSDKVNADENKCKAKRRREQGKERSIIDYVIIFQEYTKTIKSMEINKEKQ